MHTILVADDDAQFRRGLRKRLEHGGYRVLEAGDGFGVMIQVQNEAVDLVILDHEMPMGDGRTLAAAIRREYDMPIVFLSGHSRDSFRDTVFGYADTYYLPKPLDFEHLDRLVRDCLGVKSTCLVDA